jgi:phospholipase C
MDGFLRAGSNDLYSIGYYTERDLPFLSALVRHYTTLDRYFVSILGPTFPNRLFLHSASTDRLTDSVALTALPTIWDRLAEAGISGTYYFSNIPFLALWGFRYFGIASTYDQFLADAASGTLPAVSFVDPQFTTLDLDTGTDDHPHSSVKRGDSFLAKTFHAVTAGPSWSSTVFIVTFDEWGGFFEHVAPPRAAKPAGDPDNDVVKGKVLLGFRVPAVVASPFSLGDPNRPSVRHSVFDHTSILKLIEWRLGPPAADGARRLKRRGQPCPGPQFFESESGRASVAFASAPAAAPLPAIVPGGTRGRRPTHNCLGSPSQFAVG